MSLEYNSVPRTNDQSGGSNALVSPPYLNGSRPTTGGLTANQRSPRGSIHQPSNSDQSIEDSEAQIFHHDGLHRRQGHGVEEEQHDLATPTLNGSGDSSKSHTMHVKNESDDTASEIASVDTTWSESTSVPRRNLGYIQITSLMLNGTIGSGVFITPGYVLLLIRSKPIALALWALGGFYTALR